MKPLNRQQPCFRISFSKPNICTILGVRTVQKGHATKSAQVAGWTNLYSSTGFQPCLFREWSNSKALNQSSFSDAQPLMSQINDTLSSQQLIVSPAIRKCDKCSSCFGENPTMIWLACESCANWRCANCLPKSVKVTAEFFCSMKCKKKNQTGFNFIIIYL